MLSEGEKQIKPKAGLSLINKIAQPGAEPVRSLAFQELLYSSQEECNTHTHTKPHTLIDHLLKGITSDIQGMML